MVQWNVDGDNQDNSDENHLLEMYHLHLILAARNNKH